MTWWAGESLDALRLTTLTALGKKAHPHYLCVLGIRCIAEANPTTEKRSVYEMLEVMLLWQGLEVSEQLSFSYSTVPVVMGPVLDTSLSCLAAGGWDKQQETCKRCSQVGPGRNS